ncbi:hypothetical protein JYT22_00320 [Endomicrobium sp. AH-315-J14]|nr:hypothetical protein [Endomicrobium sp. AH-315-J14]
MHCLEGLRCALQVYECLPAACLNGERDGVESDIDCGGAVCLPCPLGKQCDGDEDCATGFCRENTCSEMHAWSNHFGELGGPSVSLATDAANNVLLAGRFIDTVDLGAGEVVSDGRNAFVLKLDSAGNHLWSRHFGNLGQQSYPSDSLGVDAAGNVVLSGSYKGTAELGDGPVTAQGSHDVFVLKLDASGEHLWSKSFGGNGPDQGIAMWTDPSGNVLLTGTFTKTIDFGGEPLEPAGKDGKERIYLVKLDPMGEHLWSKRVGRGRGYSVTGDPEGNVLITGFFLGQLDFGQVLPSAGQSDIFVAKLSPSGAHLWTRRFGSSKQDFGYSVATDSMGNALLVGRFGGTVDFGGGPLVSQTPTSAFIVKLSPDGEHLWSASFNGGHSLDRQVVSTDPSDNVLLTGRFAGIIDFGGATLVGGVDEDIFVAKLNPSGAHLWSRRFADITDTSAQGSGQAITGDTLGNVLFAGYFTGSVDFGGGLLSSGKSFDVFVAKYAQ